MARAHIGATVAIAWLAILVGASARAAIPSGNLIVNGDAEAGTASANSSTTAPVPIPGWTTTPNFTEHTYDPAGSGAFPEVGASAAITGGKQFFAGGPENGSGNAVETATQAVGVSTASSEIDAGGVSAVLSADLGGYTSQEDQAKVTAIFTGSSGQQLGRMQIGPVTATDRHDITALLARSGSASVPGGTRTVRVVMTATKFSGSYNDAYIDNVSLTLVPPPTLGKTVDVAPVSGHVFVKLPPGQNASSAAVKGVGFVPLTVARQLPVGSQIDARAGSLRLLTAASGRGKTQSGVFGGGLFGFSQERTGPQKGLTTLSLLENDFRGAPSFAACPRHAADGLARATAAAVSPRVLQTLRASGRGHFRTRGRYSAATVRGTVWDTADRCDGTLTVVHRGTVLVTAFGLRKTVAVKAGQYILVGPRGAVRGRLTAHGLGPGTVLR